MMAAQYVEDAEAADQLGEAHNLLIGDNSIQFDLPPASWQPPQSAPPSLDPSPASNPPPMPAPQAPPPTPQSVPAPSPSPDVPVPSGGGADSALNSAMHVFLWVAAGIALAILLYWIFAWFRDRRSGGEASGRRERKAKETAAWRPEEEQAVQLLDEADVLANEGRYDEAVHLLLHRSIGEIGAHRPDLVRPALTSRDIARHPLLPPGPASAFARIAALVERSFFARRPLGPDDWQACRVAYREFAFAEGWQR